MRRLIVFVLFLAVAFAAYANNKPKPSKSKKVATTSATAVVSEDCAECAQHAADQVDAVFTACINGPAHPTYAVCDARAKRAGCSYMEQNCPQTPCNIYKTAFCK